MHKNSARFCLLEQMSLRAFHGSSGFCQFLQCCLKVVFNYVKINVRLCCWISWVVHSQADFQTYGSPMPSSTFLFRIPSKECPGGLFKVQKSTVSHHRAADGKRGAGLSRDGTVEETLSNTLEHHRWHQSRNICKQHKHSGSRTVQARRTVPT